MIDWTAVGAIITALMVIATFITVVQNRKQLNELKRQWKDEHRPHLYLNIVPRSHAYFLKIQNYGNSPAEKVTVSINEEFKSTFNDKSHKYVENLKSAFPLGARESKYVFLGWIEDINPKWEQDVEIVISCRYDSWETDIRKGSGSIIDKRFFMVFNYTEEALNKIEKRLKETNSELCQISDTIKKSQSQGTVP